jgi:hypothetical protein
MELQFIAVDNSRSMSTLIEAINLLDSRLEHNEVQYVLKFVGDLTHVLECCCPGC